MYYLSNAIYYDQVCQICYYVDPSLHLDYTIADANLDGS